MQGFRSSLDYGVQSLVSKAQQSVAKRTCDTSDLQRNNLRLFQSVSHK